MTLRHAVAAILTLVFLPSTAHAAGFAVAEQGAASLGVAGAATARQDLAEAAWYNPAAVPPGVVASLGGSVIVPTLKHTDRGTTTSEGGPSTPPWVHAGWVGGFGRHRAGLFVVGNVPSGAGLRWPDFWPGRYEVTAIELQVFEASANAVYGIELTDDLELGVGGSVRRMRSTVELERKIDAVETEAEVMLGGAADAVGAGASLWGRWRGLSLGANYRSPATLDFEGAAHFEDVPVELSGAAHDQDVVTTVTLPERLAVGAAYDFGDGAASLDAEYFGWSRFETFAIDFADEETPDVEEPRDWHDTVALRGGYEHRLLDRALAVRGGLAFDPTPSPTDTLSPTLPDASRIVATVGVGYAFDFGLRVDASFAHVALLPTEATGEETFPGRYAGRAEVLSLGVSFRTGKTRRAGH
jgi:long-chain fatty acid transport protein